MIQVEWVRLVNLQTEVLEDKGRLEAATRAASRATNLRAAEVPKR